MTERETLSEAPAPMWAVALNKMRAFDGSKPEADVTLTPDEAFAFVLHYLDTVSLLSVTEQALRERNSRLILIERLAQGKPVTFPIVDGYGI